MKQPYVLSASAFAVLVFGLYACSSSSKSGGKTDAGADGGADSATKVADSSVGTDSTVVDSGADTGPEQDSTVADTAVPPVDSGPDVGPPLDSSTDGGLINRGPSTLQFDPSGTGDPASIWWNDQQQVLYIADDSNNEIWSWSDANGFAVFAPVEVNDAAAAASDNQLDKLVQTPDGTLIVARFGYGTYGAILTVAPDGGAGAVPNTPSTYRRIPLAVDSNGKVWGGSFVKSSQGTAGQINQVDLVNGETTYATGLLKPAGMLAVNGQLLVSDQGVNAILAIPTTGVGDGGLLDGAPYPVYASLPLPDQLALGPNGIIYTGQFTSTIDGGQPAVREIAPDGSVSLLPGATNLTQPQDVAYDPTNKRLFVADSNGTSIRQIQIYPIN